jgi:hypothetical protein
MRYETNFGTSASGSQRSLTCSQHCALSLHSFAPLDQSLIYVQLAPVMDRLWGLMVRVLGYRSRDWLTGGQSVCLGVEPTLELVTRYYFLSESCGLVSVGHSFWREDGSAVCNAITQWSESRRIRNHSLLSQLRPGGPGSGMYIPQEQGDPVIPPDTGLIISKLIS